MAEPDWNPCLNAEQNFFAATALCGCNCPSASARLQTRSASMRLGAIGHHAFNFLNQQSYRSLVTSTEFHSSRSPLNGAGNWHGSEQVTAVYDQWGNITYSGQRTRSWSEQSVHFLWKGVLMVSGQYFESATIDPHGCLQGTWQFSGIQNGGTPYNDGGSIEGKQTVASRCADVYDCPAGVGCGFPTVNITATQWTENWACSNSPNARPGSYTHEQTLSQEVTAQDILGTIAATLPAITSLPWEAHVLGVIRRVGYSNTCEGALGDTLADLQNELAALRQSASDASRQADSYQQQLSDAQKALDDYASEWQADHAAWRSEKVARCRNQGGMNDTLFAELEGRVFARAGRTQQLTSAVCNLKATVADAEAVKAVADYFVTLKQNAINSASQRWQPMLEAGGIYSFEGVSDQMPLWIDQGHAQARVKLVLDYPAQGLGETFRCTCGSHSFDLTVPAGECIAYGEPFTLTLNMSQAVTIKNITTHHE